MFTILPLDSISDQTLNLKCANLIYVNCSENSNSIVYGNETTIVMKRQLKLKTFISFVKIIVYLLFAKNIIKFEIVSSDCQNTLYILYYKL